MKADERVGVLGAIFGDNVTVHGLYLLSVNNIGSNHAKKKMKQQEKGKKGQTLAIVLLTRRK